MARNHVRRTPARAERGNPNRSRTNRRETMSGERRPERSGAIQDERGEPTEEATKMTRDHVRRTPA